MVYFSNTAYVRMLAGGKMRGMSERKATVTSGVVGCIASVVLDTDYKLNWTISPQHGSVALNVTECSL